MGTGRRLVLSGLGVGVWLVLSAAAGIGQTASPGASTPLLSSGGLISSLMAAPVIGQPYSAVQVTRTLQTLADGTTIKHSGHHVVARDAEGRVRVEMRMQKAVGDQPEMVLVFVTDPVTHTLTTWSTGGKDGKKVAAVVKLPKDDKARKGTGEAQAPARPASESGRPKAVVTREDLGTETFAGLPVEVEKTTTVLPPGRSGNDAPITKTYEVWTSADLKLVVKQEWIDPRTGEKTVELQHLSRAEPEVALFRPPPGYAVKDAMESMKEMLQKLEDAQN